MSDILNDIDDALKRDRAEKFWKENGPIIIAGAIMLVVFTGMFSAWNAWKAHTARQQTAILMAAMTDADQPQALINAAAELKGGPQAIALLNAAGDYIRDGKKAEALALYTQLADAGSAPNDYRVLARVLGARIAFDLRDDQTDINALYAPIAKISGNTKSPWALHAAMQAAIIKGEGMNDYKSALAYLGQVIQSDTAPISMKERARALDHVYALRAAPTQK